MLLVAVGRVSFGDDSERLLTIDHYVRVRSTVPAIAGQDVPIYVRERVQAGTARRSASSTDRVALFVHGAGTPAEVAFDVPQPDYSWMAYLARAGFDVFANAMWEKNRLRLFRASLEWLTGGSVNGMTEGTLRLGY